MQELLKEGPLQSVQWELAKDWNRIFEGEYQANQKIFFSILGFPMLRMGVWNLWKQRLRALPSQWHFVAHSPLSYRFMLELERVPATQVSLLPLPLIHGKETELATKELNPNRPLIATLGQFTAQNNWSQFLSVAHYVRQKNSSIQFLILGHGRLESHLLRSVEEMELEDCIKVVPDLVEPLASANAFLYLPLQNAHFLPLGIAAQYRLPILATSITGIEDYVHEGHTGFSVDVNDTKSMGELVLRLVSNPELGNQMGQRFYGKLFESYSLSRLRDSYLKLLNPNQNVEKRMVA